MASLDPQHQPLRDTPPASSRALWVRERLGSAEPLPSTRLPSPEALRERYPASRMAKEGVRRTRTEIAELIQGRDARLLAVVGPCSIHDPQAALDYAERLTPLRDELASELVIVMRAYLEKPRTDVGWKGLVHDPGLDGSGDLSLGLNLARQLLVALAERGLGSATELLDPNLAEYWADLISWAAIGARTSESQPHRELASRLGAPVGFKNGTDGSLVGALGGLKAAARPQTRVAPDAGGRLCAMRTRGNENCHLTLRGGLAGPNYDAASVAEAHRRALERGLPARVLIDCSHGNSQKDHRRQADVLEAVARQVEAGSPGVLGVMLESHLVAGKQSLSPQASALRYGQSVTDACIDFDTTAQLLRRLASAQSRGNGAARMAVCSTR